MEKRINQLQQKWNTRPQRIYRHPKYYMDTDMVVFQVDDQGILAMVADLTAI